MIDKLYIKKIKYNDNININLKSKTFKNIQRHISMLKKKYNKELIDFYNYEQINFIKYDYNLIIKNNMQYKQSVINIIKDVINLYRKKIKNLDCVFLTGSYARGTNKVSSDIDLHFFYRRKPKNFLYEEIINYIVASVLNKPRDSLDPTFILNFNNTKQKISKKMNNDALNITLMSNDEKVSYSYMQGKKRRFYLQYLNPRNLSALKKYILNQIKENNKEFNHCFEIIYGKKHFNEMYSKIYNEELKLIDLKYILLKIDSLILKMSHSYVMKEKNISFAKRLYQSVNFDLIYEYYSILRIMLIYKKKKVFFLNLIEINNNYKDKKILFTKIYKYLWYVAKFSNYCLYNKKEYSLHTYDTIKYNFTELDGQWEIVKKSIIKDLKEMRKEYEQSYNNFTNDAC